MSLGKEEVRQLLEYIREWNTKPKLCHIAQFVLFLIFKILPPTEIIEVVAFSVDYNLIALLLTEFEVSLVQLKVFNGQWQKKTLYIMRIFSL